MRRYYFHIRMGGTLIPDEEGMDCVDLAAAMEEALLSEGDMALTALASGRGVRPGTIEIEDEDGNPIDVISPKRILN